MKSKKYLELFEIFFVGLGFLFFSNAFENLGVLPSSLLSLSRYFLAFGSAFFVIFRFKSLYYKLKRNIALLLVIFLVTMSFTWSEISRDTLFAVRTQFLPMTAFGLYLSASFNTRDLVIKFGYVTTLYVLLNYFLVFAVPSIGIDQYRFVGAWTGMQAHKNGASAYSLISALFFIILSRRQSHKRWLGILQKRWFLILTVLALFFIFKTTSGTGIALSLLLVASLAIYSRFRWKGKKTVLLLDLAAIVLVLGSIVLFGYWEAILTGLGKDPSLTGRTVFWGLSLQALLDVNPLLGFGRGAFWLQPSSYLRAIEYYFNNAYQVPNAHNGYIEIALDTGLLGSGLFLLNIFTTLRRSLKQAYMAFEPVNLLPLGFTIVFLVNNATESLTSNLYSMFWPLYIAVSLNAGMPYNWSRPQKKNQYRQNSKINPILNGSLAQSN